MFDQFMQSRYPEVTPDQPLHEFLKESFYTGAKCVVVLAGTDVSPQFPGDKPQTRKMMNGLARMEEETTAFIRAKYAAEGTIEDSRVVVPGAIH